MRLINSLLILLSFSCQAFAEEAIEEYFYLLGFELEKSTIADVMERLGEATIHKEGDAASSYTGICYQNSKSKITVYFESGELGGSEKKLLTYQVRSSPYHDYPCGILSDEMVSKLSVGGLHLGEELDSTISLLPKNPHSEERLIFSYLKKIPFTKEEIEISEVENMEYAFWDQYVEIDLYEAKGKLTGYRVSKVTTW